MSWSFRKSVSFGPLRLNFSKSGIGASVGVKGARVSVGKRGTFLNLSSHGFSFRKRIDQPNAKMNTVSNAPLQNGSMLPFSESFTEADASNKSRYYTYGEHAAQRTKFDHRALDASLDYIYQTFLSEQKLDDEGIQSNIRSLQGEIAQKQELKQQAKFDLENRTHSRDAKARCIEELEVDRVKIAGRQPHIDYIPFAIGTLLVVLLTLYLVVFYSSTGYAAFYGIRPGSLGFINPNVFREAIQKGAGVISLIVLFPVIFLGLGFLIHDSLEKKKYLVIALLLTFTLVTDAIIGYKISEAIHYNSFNAGHTNDQWRFGLIFSDLNFYLVLALGFIVYIIWGVLLNYVLNKVKELQPDKALEIQLKNQDKKIEEERQELGEITALLNALKNQVRTLESDITKHEKDIIGYKNGMIPVNISQLKAAFGDFINGWTAFTQHEANKICSEARSIKDNWLTIKIAEISKR